MQQFVRVEVHCRSNPVIAYVPLFFPRTHAERALPVLNDLQMDSTVATVASDTGTNSSQCVSESPLDRVIFQSEVIYFRSLAPGV